MFLNFCGNPVNSTVNDCRHILYPPQVYPPSYTKDVSIVDLAESFVSVDEGGNSSAIQDMISLGNTQGKILNHRFR